MRMNCQGKYIHNDMIISPAGGSSEALMATPTRLEVCSSMTDNATPKPLKKAIGIPSRRHV